MPTTSELKRTPLFKEHVELGAKMVPFGGWEMPVLYSGVIKEHEAVRQAAGLFDVSHMGEIFVEGEEAEAALEALTCNKVSALTDGKALYSAITNESGGVEDDIIIYRFSKDRFLVCVNASNTDSDFAWFRSRNRKKAEFINRSSEFGLLALQGPQAERIISKLDRRVAALAPFHFAELGDSGIIAARTGYTGEDGFELFTPAGKTSSLWRDLLEAGKGEGLVPCGLGARDTLRLESCYPLHGHELSPRYSAVESGLGWIVKGDKPDYPGKDILLREKEQGSSRSLIAFFVEDSGIARENCKVLSDDGKEIGVVTSGTKTPTINRALGLAIIKSEYKEPGTALNILVRDKNLRCTIVKKPFYKRAKEEK